MKTTEQKKEEQQKTAIVLSIVIGLMLWYLWSIYGYCMFLANGNTDRAIDVLLKLFENADIIFAPINMVTLKYYLSGILIGVLGGLLSYYFISLNNRINFSVDEGTSAGTASFMTKKDMKDFATNYSNQEDFSQNIIYTQNVVKNIDDVSTRLTNNILVIGGAGTGKSRFLIKPNILQLHSSFIVTDPSGELLKDCGNCLQAHGYKIKIFNISNMDNSNRYNPFAYIRNDEGVLMMIDVLIKNTTGKGNKGDEFFTNAERLLYAACCFYLIYYDPCSANRNFAHVLDLVNMSAVDENDPNSQSPLDRLMDALPRTAIAKKYYTSFKQAAGKTLKSIIISCVTRLQYFMLDSVRNLTKSDEIHFERVGDEKTAIFVITPQADETYAFLVSMMYSQLFETLYFLGEDRAKKGLSIRSKYPVRFLLDEFRNTGEIPQFPSKLSTMRKYNISCVIILQDKTQIEYMYKDEWETLMANCDAQLCLGTSGLSTLKYYEEKLGSATVRTKSHGKSRGKTDSSSDNFSETKRALMTSDEIGRMSNEDCILFIRGQKPIKDNKYDLLKHPRIDETTDGKYGHKLDFDFGKMAAFNTNLIHDTHIIMAQSEKNRVMKDTVLSRPKKVSELITHVEPNEIKIEGNKKKEQIKLGAVMMELRMKLEREKGEIGIIKMGVPSTILYQFTPSTMKENYIVFSEKQNDKGTLYGIMSREEYLYHLCTQAGENNLHDKYNIVITVEDDDTNARIQIPASKYDVFRDYIKQNYKNDGKSNTKTNDKDEKVETKFQPTKPEKVKPQPTKSEHKQEEAKPQPTEPRKIKPETVQPEKSTETSKKQTVITPPNIKRNTVTDTTTESDDTVQDIMDQVNNIPDEIENEEFKPSQYENNDEEELEFE